MLSDLRISGTSLGPALRFPQQGQFHMLKYLRGLVAAIQRMGGEIYSGAHVSQVNGGNPVELIAPGSGAIIGWGLGKVAVDRDEQGAVHRYSAVCPHLGCIVKWNYGEKTWDCPCHGSRYDAYGRVVNGPSAEDLGPADG